MVLPLKITGSSGVQVVDKETFREALFADPVASTKLPGRPVEPNYLAPVSAGVHAKEQQQ